MSDTLQEVRTMNIQRAIELLKSYEGSETVAAEGEEPTVQLNAEDFNEILRCLRGGSDDDHKDQSNSLARLLSGV